MPSIMSRAIADGPSSIASNASCLVMAFIESAKKLIALSRSANAAPPTPSWFTISTTVFSTCSLLTVGPQMVSLMTSNKFVRPAMAPGNAAATSPTVSRALQIALPIISQILPRIAKRIFARRAQKACFNRKKRSPRISESFGHILNGFSILIEVMST